MFSAPTPLPDASDAKYACSSPAGNTKRKRENMCQLCSVRTFSAVPNAQKVTTKSKGTLGTMDSVALTSTGPHCLLDVAWHLANNLKEE